MCCIWCNLSWVCYNFVVLIVICNGGFKLLSYYGWGFVVVFYIVENCEQMWLIRPWLLLLTPKNLDLQLQCNLCGNLCRALGTVLGNLCGLEGACNKTTLLAVINGVMVLGCFREFMFSWLWLLLSSDYILGYELRGVIDMPAFEFTG